jgi:methionine synthase II (cobalamin-independent)
MINIKNTTIPGPSNLYYHRFNDIKYKKTSKNLEEKIKYYE